MPRASQSVEVGAPCGAVFDLVHDYDRRLAWDTMLSEARLLGGAAEAGVGVRSRCVGTWRGAWLPLETRYVSFERGRVAAVALTNRPPFFDRFAASIRHRPTEGGGCLVTYAYSFRARPRWLAPVLEPVMGIALRREVRGRLRALKAYAERPG